MDELNAAAPSSTEPAEIAAVSTGISAGENTAENMAISSASAEVGTATAGESNAAAPDAGVAADRSALLGFAATAASMPSADAADAPAVAASGEAAYGASAAIATSTLSAVASVDAGTEVVDAGKAGAQTGSPTSAQDQATDLTPSMGIGAASDATIVNLTSTVSASAAANTSAAITDTTAAGDAPNANASAAAAPSTADADSATAASPDDGTSSIDESSLGEQLRALPHRIAGHLESIYQLVTDHVRQTEAPAAVAKAELAVEIDDLLHKLSNGIAVSDGRIVAKLAALRGML